ncbi:MAG: TIGR02285 family protein [Desulfobacterales bacterium]|nr:TIGR02285 family protein [Desulfobacterales bacterium]
MKKKIILTIIWLFILPFHLFSQEKDTITWIENDFPPVWIVKGTYKGTGGAQLIQNLLKKKLTGYNHRKIRTNVTRFRYMMKNKEKICDCATFKTPDREKYMYFSAIPASFIMANGIITKKSSLHRFSDSPEISLNDTLKDKELILGVTSDRKFGDQIDTVLEKYKGSRNIYNRIAGDLTNGLVGMLIYDRVDYILGYDWELQYLVKKFWSPKKAEGLIFLPLKETKPYLMSYIVCTKNEWGKKVINDINQILIREVPKKGYRNIWEQWMSNKKLYRKLYKDVYLKKISKMIFKNNVSS